MYLSQVTGHKLQIGDCSMSIFIFLGVEYLSESLQVRRGAAGLANGKPDVNWSTLARKGVKSELASPG